MTEKQNHVSEKVDIRHKLGAFETIREPMSEKDWAGIVLAGVVLALIAIFSLILTIYWFRTAPSLESFGTPVKQESLQLYKEASNIAFESVYKILDLIVLTVLLPVLTLILGYLFGTRSKKDKR